VGSRTEPRPATAADAARITEIFTEAFHDDPVWGWAFPDDANRTAQHTAFWRFYVDAALSYGWVWLTSGGGAAAQWIPPGRTEIPEEDEPRLESLLVELVGSERTAFLMEVFERFEAAHPDEEPHYYLALLGTHPDHRGSGIGMGLLADTLEVIDAEGTPAYLESTNPANNEKYERLGFERRGEFSLPDDGPTVTTMWRQAKT
jgi:GNAT superfamily N-acetyltransferase